jgi:hypothetical protein
MWHEDSKAKWVAALTATAFTTWYRASNFPAGLLSSPAPLRFTSNDLAHALFVTGRAPGDQNRFGMASVWEFLHRASVVPAYVRRSQTGRLVRSRLALELDRSEKVALSYALGQAMTGIFCERELSVIYLMHIDRYSSRYGTRFSPGRKRADLFGRGPGGWVIAEAKGRSNAMESELRQKLFSQKRSIVSVAGERPWIALGCVASFPPNTQEMRIDAFDPEDEELEPIELEEVGIDRYVRAYYEPFVAAVEAGEIEQGSDQVVIARFPSLRLRVGLLREIVGEMRGSRQDSLGLYESVTSILAASPGRTSTLFRDGTFIEADWEDALSINDWEA